MRVVVAVMWLLILGGPSRTTLRASRAPAESGATTACGLLTDAEVEAVLGQPVHHTAAEQSVGAGVPLSQCVFTSPTPSRSVSVSAAFGTAGARPTALEFWRSHFHAGSPASKAAASDDGPQERPRVISNIGDEAFWAGNQIVGALYVLRGTSFIRVGVGGIGGETTRLEKSMALARLALTRLRQ